VEQIKAAHQFRHRVKSRSRPGGRQRSGSRFLCGATGRRKQDKESQNAGKLLHDSFPIQNRPGTNLGFPAIAARYCGLARSTPSSTARRCEMVTARPTQPSRAVIHAVWIKGSENISTKIAA